MRITILGKRWNLKFVRMKHNWGCVDLPGVKNKEMHINPCHPNDAELMDTVIHEITHAAFPQLNEETVEQFAKDVTRVLHHRLGYRLPIQDEKE